MKKGFKNVDEKNRNAPSKRNPLYCTELSGGAPALKSVWMANRFLIMLSDVLAIAVPLCMAPKATVIYC